MNRLVIIRVGDPAGPWATCKATGKWSSTETHSQAVRHAYVEGYSVIALFVGTGDIPLMATNVTNVRKRNTSDTLPVSCDLGPLETVIEFSTRYQVNLETYSILSSKAILDSIKYTFGSQILISKEMSADFLLSYNNNNIPVNPDYNVTTMNFGT